MYDYIIVGGGFFGCMVAQFLPGKILLLEKEKDLFGHASSNNQCRVHAGYHYPRHFPTAWSSNVNFSRFSNEFREAISENYTMLYPIARGSKTNANTYYSLYKKINAPIEVAPKKLKQFFNKEVIEEVFIGHETAFNPDILKKILLDRLSNVEIALQSEVTKIQEHTVFVGRKKYRAKKVIVCIYACTNDLLSASGLPILPIELQSTVMPLVSVPTKFKELGITIMDGEYFSIYPYPKYNMHTIHHVTYTPRGGDYKAIFNDVCRFIPDMNTMVHEGDIREIKTILSENDKNNGRPVLYRRSYYLKSLDVIIGGKLDNIYDLYTKMKSGDILNIV